MAKKRFRLNFAIRLFDSEAGLKWKSSTHFSKKTQLIFFQKVFRICSPRQITLVSSRLAKNCTEGNIFLNYHCMGAIGPFCETFGPYSCHQLSCRGKGWLGSGPGVESWRSCPLGLTFKSGAEIYEIPSWMCAANDHRDRRDDATGGVFTSFSGNCQSCEGIDTKERS